MYIKIPKPSAQIYTNVNTAKPSFDEPTLSYDDTNAFYDGFNPNAYTKIPKPSTTTYTKISKPT